MDSRTVFKRACVDTWNFYFGWNLRLLAVPALGIAGTLVHIYRVGWEAAWEEINVMISYALIPIGAFTVLLFLWNVFLTPFRILIGGEDFEAPQNIQKKTIADFTHWDSVDRFPLFQVACLWAEKEPAMPINSGPEYAHYSMLRGAWKDKQLIVVEPARRHRNQQIQPMIDLEVTRNELIRFANEKKLKPKFLFPEER